MSSRFHVWRRGPGPQELLGSYPTLASALDVAHRLVAGGEMNLVEVWPSDPLGEMAAVVRRQGRVVVLDGVA